MTNEGMCFFFLIDALITTIRIISDNWTMGCIWPTWSLKNIRFDGAYICIYNTSLRDASRVNWITDNRTRDSIKFPLKRLHPLCRPYRLTSMAFNIRAKREERRVDLSLFRWKISMREDTNATNIKTTDDDELSDNSSEIMIKDGNIKFFTIDTMTI